MLERPNETIATRPIPSRLKAFQRMVVSSPNVMSKGPKAYIANPKQAMRLSKPHRPLVFAGLKCDDLMDTAI